MCEQHKHLRIMAMARALIKIDVYLFAWALLWKFPTSSRLPQFGWPSIGAAEEVIEEVTAGEVFVRRGHR